MGIIPTVIKKPENTQAPIGNNDEKKAIAGINVKIEEIKQQNLENAKFLRGVSRKIENELERLRDIEQGEPMDEDGKVSILEGISHIENSLGKLDGDKIIERIDKLTRSVNEMSSDDVLFELGKISDTIKQLDLNGVITSIDEINASMKDMNTENILNELNRMNTSLSEFNPDVILLEIDKVNKSMRQANTENVLNGIEKVNENVSRLDTDAVIKELNRLEALVSEINSNAVLAEIDHLRELILNNSAEAAVERVEKKIDALNGQDYTNQLNDIKALLEENAIQVETMQSKLDRIATMPVMVKSVIQSENEKNLKEIDNHMMDANQQQIKKIEGLKTIIGFNLWLSLLAVVLIIVNILGII